MRKKRPIGKGGGGWITAETQNTNINYWWLSNSTISLVFNHHPHTQYFFFLAICSTDAFFKYRYCLKSAAHSCHVVSMFQTTVLAEIPMEYRCRTMSYETTPKEANHVAVMEFFDARRSNPNTVQTDLKLNPHCSNISLCVLWAMFLRPIPQNSQWLSPFCRAWRGYTYLLSCTLAPDRPTCRHAPRGHKPARGSTGSDWLLRSNSSRTRRISHRQRRYRTGEDSGGRW